jgi:hypothetical protein
MEVCTTTLRWDDRFDDLLGATLFFHFVLQLTQKSNVDID